MSVWWLGRQHGWRARGCATRMTSVGGKFCERDGSASDEGDEDGRHLRLSLVKTKQNTTLRRVLEQPSAGERRWSAMLVTRW